MLTKNKTYMSIVIIAAKRSPIGILGGKLCKIKINELSAQVVKAMSDVVNLSNVMHVIVGHVLSGGFGQNTARQLAISAGIPQDITSFTVNQVCGSGMKAIMLSCNELQNSLNKQTIIIAGGHEIMSQVPHNAFIRNKANFGNIELHDAIIADGLTDAFNKIHMGLTAEHIAKEYRITREMQDEYAYNSQMKASHAQKNKYFTNEIANITLPDNSVFDNDEFIRHDTSIERLAKLKPAFLHDGSGTVTAGNASGINDGSAMVALMREADAIKYGKKPLARIVSFAEVGVNPMLMGIGPVPASELALKRAGWNIEDLDLIEVNEAFAAQTIAVNQFMRWNTDKVNVNGGAIALGHPIGASGARIVISLIYELKRRGLRKGLATACVGGGMGLAMCIEVF